MTSTATRTYLSLTRRGQLRGLVAMLASLAMVATIVGLAEPGYATPPAAAPILVSEGVVAPLTERQTIASATDVQNIGTPAEREEVERNLTDVKKVERAAAGPVTIAGVPVLVALAVST